MYIYIYGSIYFTFADYKRYSPTVNRLLEKQVAQPLSPGKGGREGGSEGGRKQGGRKGGRGENR